MLGGRQEGGPLGGPGPAGFRKKIPAPVPALVPAPVPDPVPDPRQSFFASLNSILERLKKGKGFSHESYGGDVGENGCFERVNRVLRFSFQTFKFDFGFFISHI